ncbi:MAG: hypothetical protein CMJ64_30090 [Planctomycetaceae bacterium]|nr:hypothetical protein [Planctomycetaceae bacterium]
MHDSTRRILCRIAFAVLCLVPTSTLCAWIAYRATPLHAWQARAVWKRLIFERTGLLASIGGVERPTLQRTLLHGVTLIDPDGEKQVASIRVIDLTETNHGVVVSCSQPEIQREQLTRLGSMFNQRVLLGPALAAPIRIASGEMTLRTSAGASTFTDVRCLIGRRGESLQASAEFRLAGSDVSDTVQLQVTRERSVRDPASIWQVRTGNESLPCELLADYVPALRSFGERSQFHGTAWLEQSETSWSGEIAGRFRDVDLEQVMAPFPHKLSGIADVTVSHSRFTNGRLEEIAGSLHSSGGVISRSLLNSASASLHLTTDASSDEHSDTLLTYGLLSFGFQLDGDRLQFSGLCDAARPEIVLVGSSGQVLLAASGQAVPSVSLTRVLVPHSDVQVPATRATERLLRALPLPEIRTPAERTATLPSARLRVAPNR